ncbi:TfuA-like protein [Streptomyces sp. NBC_01306]|uniref:TfuA-like protein n=1 Tax=Streptomyces sp. NBC_01306 TaxID=2903819 RepID=UPI002254BD1F|nr:TfuA-like protein [Streptomyces sp. NBC_01306]MCX4723636.1 TfuA-like protein [Streptomyces sp. NBC_01306]
MTTRHLFIGPSAPGFVPPPGIVVRPPVAAGDLLALPLTAGDTVGIVDGYFHQVRAVPHKEILALLDRGVTVLGAASTGALRAAELDTFGMRGVGQIYEDYRCGRLDADDEVALLHGPPESGYRAMSEPLVNIRACLAAAVRDGVCTPEAAERIIAALRSVPYALRSYQRFPELAGTSGLDPGALAALGRHCARNRRDVKRADALALVEALCADARSGESAERPDGDRTGDPVPRTVFLADWEDRARRPPGEHPDHPGSLTALRVLQLFSPGFPALRRDLVLALLARECAASCGPRQTGGDAAIRHGVHRGVYPDPDEHPDGFDFLRPWLSDEEAACGDRRRQLRLFLSRSFESEPGTGRESVFLDDLEPIEEFARAARTAAACRRFTDELTAERPDFTVDRISPERIAELLVQQWGGARAEAEFHALDRGFGSFADAIEAARPYYPLVKLQPRT